MSLALLVANEGQRQPGRQEENRNEHCLKAHVVPLALAPEIVEL